MTIFVSGGATPILAYVDNSTIGINGSNQYYVKNTGITATQIANSTITTTQISGTAGITGSQLSASAGITGGQLAANSLTFAQFKNNTVYLNQSTGAGSFAATQILTPITLNGTAANGVVITSGSSNTVTLAAAAIDFGFSGFITGSSASGVRFRLGADGIGANQNTANGYMGTDTSRNAIQIIDGAASFRLACYSAGTASTATFGTVGDGVWIFGIQATSSSVSANLQGSGAAATVTTNLPTVAIQYSLGVGNATATLNIINC